MLCRTPCLASEFSIYHLQYPLFPSARSARCLSYLISTDTKITAAREIWNSYTFTSKNWIPHSIGTPVSVVLVEDEEKKAWEECKQIILSLNFDHGEASLILGKAFGWVDSPYWGEERKKELPACESLNMTLDYLRSLGLSDDDLHKLLKKFPEVLGCDLNNEVKENIATLEKDWKIKDKTLRSLLLRNPKVLGYNVDCKGDCIAKCTRCWVRF